MADIGIRLDMKEWLDFVGPLPRKLETALNRGLEAAAFLVEAQAKIKTPVDTGRLKSSIYTKVGSLNAFVSTNVNYARYVHDGTKFMKPRPFMLEGLQSSEYNIRKAFDIEIKKALT